MSDTPTLRRKPYQKKGLTTPQKLMVAVVFLAFVAFAIGGEDRPGIVTMAQKTMEDGTGESDDAVLQGASELPVAQQQESAQNDAELNDWYASAAPDPNPLAGPDTNQQNDNASDEPEISPGDVLILEGELNGKPIQIGPNT